MTASQENVKHLAIIMDGNGRWASLRGLSRGAGHKAGIQSVRRVLRNCQQYQIQHLTLFAFSSENWRRPRSEVKLLMELFRTTLKKELPELIEQGVRLHFIGDINAFDPKLQHSIQQAEQQTANNQALNLNIAVNYGGQWDIVQAGRRLAEQVAAGELQPDAIDIAKFAENICLADIPAPDLLIRTGGEFRISNFLNWQLAYTELYFTDCLWPDFTEQEMAKAMQCYAGRQRRFGRTPEQVTDQSDDQSDNQWGQTQLILKSAMQNSKKIKRV